MNTQKPQPVMDSVPGEARYSVHSVFRTIQGEGPFVGCPSIFVRLAGCNLQCPECDTSYTTALECYHSVEELVDWIYEVKGESGLNLVVITGGEPFRQELTPLVVHLLQAGFGVQVETNGTIYRETFPYALASVVCSPKVAAVHPNLVPHVRAWKYVVGPGDMDEFGLPMKVLGSSREVFRIGAHESTAPIYLQPLDTGNPEINAAYLQKTIAACIQHGHRLCVQVHKMVGLD